MDKYTAVVLAAGAGTRMHSKTKKQYLMLKGKPVLYYSLAAFEKHPGIGEIILVCGEEDISWCRQEIVVKFAFQKIKKIIPGGRERYHSVYEGLKAAGSCDWVLIHDGARPVLDQEILDRVLAALPRYRACVAAVPVKDTIKRGDSRGFVTETLPREELWTIQTPQAFSYREILDAYEKLMEQKETQVKITDDAMVAEYIHGTKVKLIEGSYKNIKITTPEDMELAAVYLREI